MKRKCIKEMKIGNVCRCKHGKLGVVTSFAVMDGVVTTLGIGFDGKKWRSVEPKLVASNLKEFLRQLIAQCYSAKKQ